MEPQILVAKVDTDLRYLLNWDVWFLTKTDLGCPVLDLGCPVLDLGVARKKIAQKKEFVLSALSTYKKRFFTGNPYTN